MPKIFSLLTALAAIVFGVCSPAFAQVGQIPFFPPIQNAASAAACGGDTDYAAWVAVVGTPGATQAGATCNLITNLQDP